MTRCVYCLARQAQYVYGGAGGDGAVPVCSAACASMVYNPTLPQIQGSVSCASTT